MTVLGFDYGTKKIGVAVGQTLTASANPLQNVAALKNKPDWEQIGRLIQEWQPDALVVGLPVRSDGSASHTTQAAQRFMRQLEGRYRLPVYAVNEYLSSYAAARRDSGAPLDAVAAQIILETWLSENEHATD